MVSDIFWSTYLVTSLPCWRQEPAHLLSPHEGSGCPLLSDSGWLSGRAALQYHRQTLQLEHSLLGGGNDLCSHYSWFLPAPKHPHQDGSSAQEGRVKSAGSGVRCHLWLPCTLRPAARGAALASAEPFSIQLYIPSFPQVALEVISG